MIQVVVVVDQGYPSQRVVHRLNVDDSGDQPFPRSICHDALDKLLDAAGIER